MSFMRMMIEMEGKWRWMEIYNNVIKLVAMFLKIGFLHNSAPPSRSSHTYQIFNFKTFPTHTTMKMFWETIINHQPYFWCCGYGNSHQRQTSFLWINFRRQWMRRLKRWIDSWGWWRRCCKSIMFLIAMQNCWYNESALRGETERLIIGLAGWMAQFT